MKIAQIAGELAPYSKSGGLGDVTSALARTLARRDHEVITVSPRYKAQGGEAHSSAAIHLGGTTHDVTFFVDEVDGVRHVLVDHPLFHRAEMYGSYTDNHLRFAVLSFAGIEATRRLLGTEQVLFHCHDWHTSLVPIYLQAYFRPLGLFWPAKTVLTLHNPAHQGRFPGSFFRDLDLPMRWMEPWALEWYGDVSLLKGGILRADAVTTVSPGFARELAGGAAFGLETIIGRSGIQGILNGIDIDEWNPATDPHLPAHYDASDLSGKKACKTALQEELGLPASDAPLVGSVGRLDPQKGVELIIESIPWLVRQGAQVVVLGSAQRAHKGYEQQLRNLERAWPDQVRSWIGFSEPLAHRIEAGADLFVMPSRFEPCGLNQLYSMRYGTPPVVRATGGLLDSVQHGHTGWLFGPSDGFHFREALWQALRLYQTDRAEFDAMRVAGMRRDWSWDRAIRRYEEVYQRVCG